MKRPACPQVIINNQVQVIQRRRPQCVNRRHKKLVLPAAARTLALCCVLFRGAIRNFKNCWGRVGGTGGGHIPLHLIVLRCDNLLQGILKYNKNIIFNFFLRCFKVQGRNVSQWGHLYRESKGTSRM